MTIRVHNPAQLLWRRIGDIPMGDMIDHIDPTEREAHICFHETGDATAMQLMEMRLNPGTLIAPHAHDDNEIVFIVEGSIHWGEKALAAGGSLHIPAGTYYSFTTGTESTRLLIFRARADHSFLPMRGDTA